MISPSIRANLNVTEKTSQVQTCMFLMAASSCLIQRPTKSADLVRDFMSLHVTIDSLTSA